MANVTIIPPSIQAETGRIRVAAYCRVSSGSDDQLNSYMAQMAYYRHKFDDSETETLTDIYADEGITGTRDDKRTEFQRMIRDCRKGKIDRIYTKSISRFARNTKDCLEYLRELKSLGISVFFEKENIDTARTSDEMMITILGGLAQEESVSISNNLMWSIRKRMQNGTFRVASTPYGYSRQGDTIIINESQAFIVREIFAAYLSGKGIRAISNMLNERGILMDKSGGIWYEREIRYILTNEKYIGDSLWNKHYTVDPITHKTKRNHGEADQYYVADTHEPIIEKSVFYKVQELLALKGAKYAGDAVSQYVLKKSMRCAVCNSIYRLKRINGSICWTCKLHDFDAARCPNMAVTQEAVYEAFIRVHNKLYTLQKAVLTPLITVQY